MSRTKPEVANGPKTVVTAMFLFFGIVLVVVVVPDYVVV